MDRPDGGLELRSDPTALAPERLLVFEVRGSVSNFVNAIRNVPGLELIDEETLPSDDDVSPAAYLVVPNDAALRQVAGLWSRWVSGRSMAKGFTPWHHVFDTLRDVRAWGPQDRVSEAERNILKEEIYGRHESELVPLEIELIFRRDGDATEAQVSRAIAECGGRIVSRARIADIAYHAILSELPVSAIQEIIDLDNDGISGLEPIQNIRPQSLASQDAASDVEQSSAHEGNGVPGEPILALIDGVPIQRHPLLAEHVIVEDVFELEGATPIESRVHGTAMASLIVHGDRNNSELPLPRKIVSVPVMGRNDEFPSGRLIVDLIYQAIMSLKDGELASAPHVTIVNISLGNKRRPFHGTLSPWARLLDRLAYRFGILFLVSAGNVTDSFPVDGFERRIDFEDASDADRSFATIRSIDSLKTERRLFSPAESVNGITIGAGNFDWVPMHLRRTAAVNIDPYAGLSIANPSSAMGPGFGKSVKPELIYPGARELLSVSSDGDILIARPPGNASRAAGLKVAAPPRIGVEAAEGYSNGTSAATALASRTAHRIHDALEVEYGAEFLGLSGNQRAAILKALLVHPATWNEPTAALIKEVVGPRDGRQHVKQKDNIRRFLGYGTYNPDDAVACAADRATFWATGEIGPGQNIPISVPIPSAYGGKAQPHSFSASLAWMTPVNSGRQGYRAVRLKMVEPGWLGELALKGNSDQPDQNQMSRGTVASRTWSGDQAAVVGENDSVNFEIVRMPDMGAQAEGQVTFGFAATILMPNVNEIYEQVRERVRPRLLPRV